MESVLHPVLFLVYGKTYSRRQVNNLSYPIANHLPVPLFQSTRVVVSYLQYRLRKIFYLVKAVR